jgi:hypothetical protein
MLFTLRIPGKPAQPDCAMKYIAPSLAFVPLRDEKTALRMTALRIDAHDAAA